MRRWPHAPSREVTAPGTYIVTAATLHRAKLFHTPGDLENLHDLLLEIAAEFSWELQAWAVFANHYHFVGYSAAESNLKQFTKKLHGLSAIQLNKSQNSPGRQVWYEYWQTRLTFEKSYLARLHYVHNNPVRHGLVGNAADYPWCSMRWFQSHGHGPFVDTVLGFPIDTVNVPDDF